jgi:hypothetical protein
VKEWGCAGLIGGSLVGLLGALLFLLALRTPPPTTPPQAPLLPPDISIFISEQSLNRLAAEAVEQPLVIDVVEHGQLVVSTPSQVGFLEPVVHVGLGLQMDGREVTSQILWTRLGFVSIPARWLPAQATVPARQLGPTIQSQIPADFQLVGLVTTAEGIEFQLKWVGQ